MVILTICLAMNLIALWNRPQGGSWLYGHDTASTSSVCIRGQYMMSRAVLVVYCTPMWDACALVVISVRRAVGITIRVPRKMRPFCVGKFISVWPVLPTDAQGTWALSPGHPIWMILTVYHSSTSANPACTVRVDIGTSVGEVAYVANVWGSPRLAFWRCSSEVGGQRAQQYCHGQECIIQNAEWQNTIAKHSFSIWA